MTGSTASLRRATDEVAARLEAGTTKLRPQDWKSGDRLYVMTEACFEHVEVIAPFGGAEEIIKDLKANVFPTEPIRFVAVTKEGKRKLARIMHQVARDWRWCMIRAGSLP